MNHVHHLIQIDNDHALNVVAQDQLNPTPLIPLAMVIQNPLPNQGMVATQPLLPQTPAPTLADPPIDPGVHHLMTLSSDVNLQTRRNQYGSTIETVNPCMPSTSTTLNMSLHLSIPPMNRTAKVLWFTLHHVMNNSTSRETLNYSIVDDLPDSPSSVSSLEVI